jgi:hypothetical protein
MGDKTGERNVITLVILMKPWRLKKLAKNVERRLLAKSLPRIAQFGFHSDSSVAGSIRMTLAFIQ